MHITYITTKHDRNGNPRGGWVVTERPGAREEYIFEGYEGNEPLYQFFGVRSWGEIPEHTYQAFDVTVECFKRSFRHLLSR